MMFRACCCQRQKRHIARLSTGDSEGQRLSTTLPLQQQEKEVVPVLVRFLLLLHVPGALRAVLAIV